MKYKLHEKIARGIQEQLTQDEISQWKAYGIDTLEEIEAWLNIGVTSPEQAGLWKTIASPEQAKEYLDIGDYETISKWVEQGFSSAKEIQEWMTFTDDPEEAYAWYLVCEDVETAGEWIAAGFEKTSTGLEEIKSFIGMVSPAQAKVLKDANITAPVVEEYLQYCSQIEQILMFVKNNIDLREVPVLLWQKSPINTYGEAKIWMDKGFTFKEAVIYSAAGYTITTALQHKTDNEELPDVDLGTLEYEDGEIEVEPSGLEAEYVPPTIEDIESGVTEADKKKKKNEKPKKGTKEYYKAEVLKSIIKSEQDDDKEDDEFNMSKKDAAEALKKYGYTDEEIKKLKENVVKGEDPDDPDKDDISRFSQMQYGYDAARENKQKINEGSGVNDLLMDYIFTNYYDGKSKEEIKAFENSPIPQDIIQFAQKKAMSFYKEAGLANSDTCKGVVDMKGNEYFLGVYFTKKPGGLGALRLGYFDKKGEKGWLSGTTKYGDYGTYLVLTSPVSLDKKKIKNVFIEFVK